MSKIVFHIYLCAPSFRNKGVTKGFIESGYDCHEFDYNKHKTILGVDRMRKQILKQAYECSPDVIFAQIHTEGILDIETVNELMTFAPVVLFNIDARHPHQYTWLYELTKPVTH